METMPTNLDCLLEAELVSAGVAGVRTEVLDCWNKLLDGPLSSSLPDSEESSVRRPMGTKRKAILVLQKQMDNLKQIFVVANNIIYNEFHFLLNKI